MSSISKKEQEIATSRIYMQICHIGEKALSIYKVQADLETLKFVKVSLMYLHEKTWSGIKTHVSMTSNTSKLNTFCTNRLF